MDENPHKAPFGFLILGTLVGAAFGGIYSDAMNLALGVAAGGFVGLFCGIAAERYYAAKLKMFDVLLVCVIVLILIFLFAPPVPPAYRE